MSDDLVKRLRFCAHIHPQFGNPENGKLFAEAAARIEALEAALLAADELATEAFEIADAMARVAIAREAQDK